jgi:hydrogenase maturation protease
MNGVATDWSPERTRSSGMLVIGFGNVLRGDDGVGPAVVEALEALGIDGLQTEAHHQLTPELAIRLSEAAFVVFVDASVERSADAVVVRELRSQDGVGGASWTGHRLTPEALLGLSLELWGRRPKAWCVEVPVSKLGWGPGLTAQARHGVQMAVEAILVLKGSQECTKQA